MKRNILLGLFAMVLFLFSACNSNVYYSDIKSIPNEKWDVTEPLTFKVNIEDSMQYYNMFIHLRNTTDFETQNFYVFMRTTYPDGHAEQDTLCFILCDPYGKWTGKGQGRIKDNKFLFQKNIRFPFNGEYTFSVTQGMRVDKVNGVSDFGISLEKFK